MGEGYLGDSMIAYIEREIASSIDSDSIIDEFYSIKNRRAQLIQYFKRNVFACNFLLELNYVVKNFAYDFLLISECIYILWLVIET